jgi:hypothetical protein
MKAAESLRLATRPDWLMCSTFQSHVDACVSVSFTLWTEINADLVESILIKLST